MVDALREMSEALWLLRKVSVGDIIFWVPMAITSPFSLGPGKKEAGLQGTVACMVHCSPEHMCFWSIEKTCHLGT